MRYNRNYQGLLLLVPVAGRPFRPHSEFRTPAHIGRGSSLR